jgi:hypothetical protein
MATSGVSSLDLRGIGEIARRMDSSKFASGHDEIASDMAREDFIEAEFLLVFLFFTDGI